jgi:hypothetical protein
MLLVLTNSADVTADYLVSVLRRNAINLFRFDTDTCLSNTTIKFASRGPFLHRDGLCYDPLSFTNVWYRRPQRLVHKTSPDTPESAFTLDEWAEAFEGFFESFQPQWHKPASV